MEPCLNNLHSQLGEIKLQPLILTIIYCPGEISLLFLTEKFSSIKNMTDRNNVKISAPKKVPSHSFSVKHVL